RGTGAAAGLDDVGVQGALYQESNVGDLPRGGLERPDELASDDFPLVFGVGDPGQRGEEAVRGVDHVQPDAGGLDVVGLHLFRLTGTQQPVVDEHAGELVADRLVDEGRGDRGVHAAGQAADDLPVADPGADGGDLFLDDVRV